MFLCLVILAAVLSRFTRRRRSSRDRGGGYREARGRGYAFIPLGLVYLIRSTRPWHSVNTLLAIELLTSL